MDEPRHDACPLLSASPHVLWTNGRLDVSAANARIETYGRDRGSKGGITAR
jgi:hypothetical protein